MFAARVLIGALAGSSLLAGCGRGTITAAPIGARPADYSPADRLRVMLPATGSAGEAAGRIVSARVVEVLQQTHGDVALVPTADAGEGLAAAREAKAVFLIAPVIVEWTDSHAPPLTADRIAVRLELRDVAAGETVSAVTFENVSSLLAVVDTRPEALLDSGFDRAVTMLIATGTAPAPAAAERRPPPLDPGPMDERKYPRQ